jgi:hypothetical protein
MKMIFVQFPLSPAALDPRIALKLAIAPLIHPSTPNGIPTINLPVAKDPETPSLHLITKRMSKIGSLSLG